jgi:hypothetical protein
VTPPADEVITAKPSPVAASLPATSGSNQTGTPGFSITAWALDWLCLQPENASLRGTQVDVRFRVIGSVGVEPDNNIASTAGHGGPGGAAGSDGASPRRLRFPLPT